MPWIRHSVVPPTGGQAMHLAILMYPQGKRGRKRDVEIGMCHFHCRVLEASVSLFYLLLSIGGFRVGL